MPRGAWSKKDERRYEHIYSSCVLRRGRGKESKITCKRIAAATVNKTRRAQGRTKAQRGLRGCPCARRGG